MTASGQGLRFSNLRGREIRDPILEELDDSRVEDLPRGRGEGDPRIAAIEPGSLLGDSTAESFGYVRLPGPLFSGAAGRPVQPRCPLRIEVAPPLAYSFADYRRLVGADDSDVAASAPEGKRVVVLVHAMTPVYRAGEDPAGVLCLGYSVRIDGSGATTVDWHPKTDAAPAGAIQLSARIVQSSPIGAGGVGWGLYRRAGAVEPFLQLLQTITVPRDAATLSVKVTTWIRWSCRFLGFGPRQWTGRPYPHVVDLPGE